MKKIIALKYSQGVSLLIVVLGIALIMLGLLLGNWQLRRAAEKEHIQERQQLRQQLPTLTAQQLIELSGTGTGQSQAWQQLQGRSLQITGEFLAEKTLYLDNRLQQGRPGFHVLTPLRFKTARGQSYWLLVLRGWLVRDVNHVQSEVPKLAAALGEQLVQGYLQSEIAQSYLLDKDPARWQRGNIWQHLDWQRARQTTGLPLLPVLLIQTNLNLPADTGLQLVTQTRSTDAMVGMNADKHRGYAFQWFSLTGLVTVLLMWYLFKLSKTRGARGPTRED